MFTSINQLFQMCSFRSSYPKKSRRQRENCCMSYSLYLIRTIWFYIFLKVQVKTGLFDDSILSQGLKSLSYTSPKAIIMEFQTKETKLYGMLLITYVINVYHLQPTLQRSYLALIARTFVLWGKAHRFVQNPVNI